MEESQIKSYGFNATMEFIDKNYDDAAKKRILSAISPDARGFIDVAKKAQWARPAYSSELWAAMLKEHASPEQGVAQLVKAGRYQGSYATNTYLKLLMKMLTVKMFAKKIPDFWSRDANFGVVTIDDLGEIDQGAFTLRFKDLKFAYFGPVCEGWFSFSLETMGLKNVKVALQDWSLDRPDPGALAFRLTWAK